MTKPRQRETLIQVVAMWSQGVVPANRAPDERVSGIRPKGHEDDKRYCHAPMAVDNPQSAQCGQHQTQDRRAAIAHEYPGGGQIKQQKAKSGRSDQQRSV